MAPHIEIGAQSQLPVVTTIIRYHKSGDTDALDNALLSLLAMRGCIVMPLIAAQDLSKDHKERLGSAWLVLTRGTRIISPS